MSSITWENPTYFTVSGNTVTAQLDASTSASGATNGQKVCYVQSAQTLSGFGDYFEFVCPNIASGNKFWVGITEDDGPACTPVGGSPSYCEFAEPDPAFYFNGTTMSFTASVGVGVTDPTPPASVTVTPTTVFKIYLVYYFITDHYRVDYYFYVDGRTVGAVRADYPSVPSNRLVVVAGERGASQPSVKANYNPLSEGSNQLLEVSAGGSVIGQLTAFQTGAMRLALVAGTIDDGGVVQASADATFYDASGEATSDVTWEHGHYADITGGTVVSDIDPSYSATGNTNSYWVSRAQSSQTLETYGDYFEFTIPEYNAGITDAPSFRIGVTQFDNPAGKSTGSPLFAVQYLIPETGLSIYANQCLFGKIVDPESGFFYDSDFDETTKTDATVFRIRLITPEIPACADVWTLPTPTAYPIGDPLYSNFNEIAPLWGEFGQTFGDRKPAHNTIQTTGVRRFEIEYNGLDETQAAILDNHWDSTRGGLSFTLVHPRTAETITGVRYDDGGYRRPPHRKKWAQSRTVRLIKTP